MRNTAKTTVLLAGLAGLILWIGSFWGQGGLTIAVVIALVMVGGSYWFSDKLAIRSARAQEVQPHQLPQYWTIMRELSELSGLPMPRLYISPDPQPNAFATGRNPSHAAVCVTEGLVRNLDWYEISRRAGPRDGPHPQPRHPDRFRGRCDCHRDHVRGPT